MSRIRSIHPGLWTDERFVSVQPITRLLFMGIWNECDDQGIFEWSPLKLKMRLLPADNADAAAMLDELEEVGSVLRFTVAGKSYGAVRNFTKYQRPKKPNAVHPATPQATAFAAGSGEPVPNQLPTEEEIPPQREEEGGKREDPPEPPRKRGGSRGTVLPEDWPLPSIDDLTPKAMECALQWTRGSYEAVGEAFVLYWRRTGKTTKDWHLTFCGWVLREHSKVMRDQKFGNGHSTPIGKAANRPMNPAELRSAIAFAEDNNNPDRAAELKAQLERLTARQPPGQIGAIVRQAAKSIQANAA